MTDPGGSDQLVLDGWITPQEASEMLGVTSQHVRYLAREGLIEARKFGYAWMVKQSSVEEYAATDRRPGPKPRGLSPSD